MLVQNIDVNGFCVIPDYIGSADLEHLQCFVEGKVRDSGGGYFRLAGKQAFQGTMLDAISDSPAFINLMHRVYEKGYKQPPPKQQFYQLMRCLNGESSKEHLFYFHYDSYAVTALLPIAIPNGRRAGHLIMLPNIRTIRKSYIRNVLDKAIIENKFAQLILRLTCGAMRFGFKKLQPVPGNLYIFWGYRSLHANDECDPDQIRATALYHFGNPHMESPFHKDARKTK